MKKLSAEQLDNLLAFLATREEFIFFDTSKPDRQNCHSLLFLDPHERVQFHHGDDEHHFFARLESYMEQGYHIAGWFGYEFGYLFEPGLKKLLNRSSDQGGLLADLGIFSAPALFDHQNGDSTFPQGEQSFSSSAYHIDNLIPSQDKKQYIEAVEAIKCYLEAGDTYQVNYTLKFLFDITGSIETLYRTLRASQSVSYGAYMRWGDERVLSFSPELFFRRTPDSVQVRPMKGTLSRGRDPEEDARRRQFLRTDAKNRSENVMIVDLLRNDLGRLMHSLAGGSVQVESLFDVEVYETLLQMTSTISATHKASVAPDISLETLFRALYPCGSVTGAPKIRTMEIIHELEPRRRGVYTGAIGYLAPDRRALFNVPIRTLALKGNRGEMGIGSGIVYDSDPQQEWQECLLKGQFLTRPLPQFQLIETLLWQPETGFWLLQEHLRRLSQSAAHFLFQYDRDEVVRRLAAESATFTDGCMRVRLLLDKDATISLESYSCAEPAFTTLAAANNAHPDQLLDMAFSEEVVDAEVAWYFHKTTRREMYTQQYRKAQRLGLADVCFVNSRGEVTEGTISNIIIYSGGEYLTPPVSSGLLAGVMRGVVLQEEGLPVREQKLTPQEVLSAEAVYLCNSVRGIIPVRCVELGAVEQHS